MIKELTNEKEMSLEEMNTYYSGLVFLYIYSASDVYNGRVIAISDFDDYNELRKYEREQKKNGKKVRMGVSDRTNTMMITTKMEVF